MWNAPKVGPFSNSFAPDVPDYFVSDVHSGGGGMLPHQGTAKPEYETKAGGVAFAKSERELTIERSPHFHATADVAARKAVAMRTGGRSVRQAQAVQWGEEQLQRGAEDPKHYPTHKLVYSERNPNISSGQFHAHGDLNAGGPHPAPGEQAQGHQGKLF
jgi:hypothetical protein